MAIVGPLPVEMTGDAAYESEPEVEDDSYVGRTSARPPAPVAPAAKVNIGSDQR